MAFGTLRADTIQADGGTAKTVDDIVVSGGDIGAATATTPATGDDDTSVATTAFVKAQAYATLASPTFTGTVTLPTGTVGITQAATDNDTSIATTAYVKDQLDIVNTYTRTQSVTPDDATSDTAIDMSLSNFIEVGSTNPTDAPTNLVVGTSGVFYADTAAPTSWHANFKHPGGAYTAPTTFPAIAPWYIAETDEILVGSWTQGIA